MGNLPRSRFVAKLRIWQVPACKMKPQIVFLCYLAQVELSV